MFTGIIEEMGEVKEIVRQSGSIRLTVLAKTVREGLKTGESITINGVCTTVVAFGGNSFSVDLSPETARVTTLGGVKVGEPVNLERAMQLNDRIGGHLVSGHVEGVGVIRERHREENAIVLTIEAPPEVLKYCVKKGSIAIDGISLTVNTLTEQGFTVAIIPHTAEVTTLGWKEAGSPVNLESDLIGKYIERLLKRD
ncbi:MAG: riboflavin synthase [Candidatus Manganitrophaceae bacterium]